MTEEATAIEIKDAFRKLVLVCHPDRNPGNSEAEEAFKRIKEAYNELTGKSTGPDNSSSLAFQCLHEMTQRIVLNLLQQGQEIKNVDLVGRLRQEITSRLREANEDIKGLDRSERNFQEILKRVSGEQAEVIRQIAQLHLKEIEREREGPERRKEALLAALEVVKSCSFDVEKIVAQGTTVTAEGITFQVSRVNWP